MSVDRMIEKYGVNGSIILLKGIAVFLIALIVVLLFANVIISKTIFNKLSQLESSGFIICDEGEFC